jgi:hypothetical protein
VAEFFGETFEAPERFNMRAFTRFAALAEQGIDDADMSAVAAVDRLITQSVKPEDLGRFDALCDKERPSVDELMEFIGTVISEVTDRPTERPSDSTDGPSTTATSSAADSSSAVIHRLEQEGRASVALMVMQQAESRGSRASA